MADAAQKEHLLGIQKAEDAIDEHLSRQSAQDRSFVEQYRVVGSCFHQIARSYFVGHKALDWTVLHVLPCITFEVHELLPTIEAMLLMPVKTSITSL